MHEWALAEAILASAKEIAEKEKLRKSQRSPSGLASSSRLNAPFCVSPFHR